MIVNYVRKTFILQATADLIHLPQNYLTELDRSRNFDQDPFISSKLIKLFLEDTHTDRQTDTHTHPPIHIKMDNFLMPFLIPFLAFAHSVYEG